MRFVIVVTLSLLISFKSHAQHDFSLYPTALNSPASLFETSEKRIHSLGNFQGKITILNFWSVNCKPCIVEMPSLNRLQKELRNEGVEVVALVNTTEDVSKVRSFFRRYKIRELKYYIDNDNFTASSFKVNAIPTSFIFDRQGKLVAYVDGSIDWMSKENFQFMKDLATSKQ